MRIVLFCHSLLSDWNHGNAHFLRGVVAELQARKHDVQVYEPRNSWSMLNLLAEHGEEPVLRFMKTFPHLRSHRYDPAAINLDIVLNAVDLVIVHEWNDHDLVRRIGEHRARNGGYALLFHDTHHRTASASEAMANYDLRNYDGVLAFGSVIRDIYLRHGWAAKAWVWHEAADVRIFRPLTSPLKHGEVVWVGNWGDDERAAELMHYMIEPVRRLRLPACVYGVRYPAAALAALARADIRYGGWLANHLVPETFARYRVTVHVPRRQYAQSLPGIPTIRPFEAMACGIPLISSPWDDTEKLFKAGRDYLVARDGAEMERRLKDVVHDDSLAAELSRNGRAAILERHTCAHRVDELMSICRELGVDCAAETADQTPVREMLRTRKPDTSRSTKGAIR